MTLLVIIGTVTTLVGLAGLVVCIRKAEAIKTMEDKEAASARLHGLVALNMGSMCVAGIGLAMVVVGLLL